MITITKQNDGVLFEFEDSKKYLYGNGSILVPFNTLSIVADESDMITLKKAASNDVFLSARYDTDFGYRSKDDAIDDLKDLLFAETGGGGGGSGVTSGQVQSMIDESISGKADTSAVTAVDNALSAYSATTDARLAEDEEVTAAALNNLDETKQGKLAYYEENTEDGFADIYITNDDGEGNVDEYSFNLGTGSVDLAHYNQYDDGQGNTGYTSTNIQFANPEINIYAESEDNGETETTTLTVYPTGVTINGENVATEPYVDAAISGKADTSAVTAAIDAATSGKVDTSAITTSITSSSTNSEVAGAKAVYDAIQAGGGGSANVIELTQAQYDALSGSVDPSAIYVITDATAYDPSTKVDTSAITSSITSGSTDAQVPSAKATYDAITAATTGGGATYSAGTNISIDTGNTISCTLPFTVDSSSIMTNGNARSAGGNSFICGYGNIAKNDYEFKCGVYGKSMFNPSQTSAQTLFSVGNGTSSTSHNAFEIRRNGDIYVNDGTNDVRLQDTILALGGLKFVKLTQSEYDQLATKDANTLYIISNVVS